MHNPQRELCNNRLKRWFAISLSLAITAGSWSCPAFAESNLPNFSLPMAPIIGDDASTSQGADNAASGTAASADGSVSGGVSESATTSSSSSSTTPSLTVDDVKIVGNHLVSTEDILKAVKTKHGDKFDRDQVMQDLKAINGLGYFDDRSLQVTPELSNGGVLLKIRVQENAPITQFAFQGNQVLSSEDISKVFSDQLGRPQNLNQLSGAIDKVEQAYHQRGFILARVY